jgi:hypothetical protein
MSTDAAADMRLDAVLENCIFYISPMYEFSHSLGHKRTNHPGPKTNVVRYSSKADTISALGRVPRIGNPIPEPAPMLEKLCRRSCNRPSRRAVIDRGTLVQITDEVAQQVSRAYALGLW